MPPDQAARDALAAEYFELLEFEPYPVQEEALLAWFTSKQGVLVCAPTGTGKTLIAEAAIYEALKNSEKAYYTTPLIALTDQKFEELRGAAERWGFSPDSIGLVTGNRRVNADAPILVVVAEILLNRLLHHEAFDFGDVSSVVMDEFHSFNDPSRGIVWELSLGLLPKQIRTLLLSATVGNSYEFVSWLRHRHDRDLELVESDDRKVPLTFQWIPDQYLADQIEEMARGDVESRKTPGLVFCFNREECWSVAEQLKGKKVIDSERQKIIASRLDDFDFSLGAGPKLRQLLIRGVGVHHAGVIPRYRRIVETLFQEKLLTICVCTETLAAGINLPARSVVIPCLIKGPPGRKKLIEASSAHQMFGRAGRPQFDSNGYIFSLPHEDDVKILRWKEKYDQIPEDTKDPGLRKAKKQLKKKMPKRRETMQYWNESQFEQLKSAHASKLSSRGTIPWRWLAYLLNISPDIDPIRKMVSKRLLSDKQLQNAQKELNGMLLTMHRAGYVELEPKPMEPTSDNGQDLTAIKKDPGDDAPFEYIPRMAHPTDAIDTLMRIRSVNPLYGIFLVNQLGIANKEERIQAFESVLELPRSVGPAVRVPRRDELPPGPLQTTRLDMQLLQLGLVSAEELGQELSADDEEERDRRDFFDEPPPRMLNLAEKLRLLFDHDFPGVHDVYTNDVWVAGEVLQFGGDFNAYVTSKKLQKQEGIVFRHLLRMILLLEEFALLCPPELDPAEWQTELDDISDKLADACEKVDPQSTQQTLEEAKKIEQRALDDL